MKSRLISTVVNRLTGGRRKFGWWTCQYSSSAQPIIIGGCGRSGTTLMRAILNAHSSVSIGPESGIFCGAVDPDHLAEVFQLPVSKIIELYHTASCLGEFVELIMNTVNPVGANVRWGEKSPCNVNSLGHIYHFFPFAKFIHMIRDGRDVVCSLRHHPKYRWVNGERVPTNITNPWNDCVSRWVRDTIAGLHWRGDDRYLEVRYETLISEPEPTIRSILKWLGLDWDSKVLEYHRTHEERASDVANPGVKSSIYTSSKNRWRNDMTAEAKDAFGSDALALLVKLGYATDTTWVNEISTATVNRTDSDD